MVGEGGRVLTAAARERSSLDCGHEMAKGWGRRGRAVSRGDRQLTHRRVSQSLYEAFEPAEAKRLADRLELHYTPKHGSWLNMAEIELAVLADQATLERAVAAWQATRNAAGRGVDWRFTTADARIKLKHLYPAIQG